MPPNLVGRRVASIAEVTEAGDYCGPIRGYTGDKESMFFLLPIARDPDAPRSARSVHHVTFPPHVYRECADGSLEVRESIGALGWPDDDEDRDGYVWHGYLDEGHVWRSV